MRRIFSIFAVIAVLCSCSVTRHVPDGERMLIKNSVEIDKQEGLRRSEEITEEQLEPYIRQLRPARFLGTNFPVWLYSQARPGSNTWFSRMERNIGAAPVFLDTVQTRRSADNMRIYMDGRGFLNAAVTYSLDTTKYKKAKVTYLATPEAPYRIRNIDYEFRDEFLRSVIFSDTASTLLHEGDIFDVNVLDSERNRITGFLKNKGYYKFSVNSIRYIVDSTVGNRNIDLRLVVRQYVDDYDAAGQPVLNNNRIYRIKNIYIDPAYNISAADSDISNSTPDTMEYLGLNIIYDKRLNVRPEVLRRNINIYPNYLYSEDGVKRTYDNIMRLGYFRNASVLFSPAPADSADSSNLVSFIGDEGNDGSVYTQEDYLNCNIQCTPALKQSFSVEFEGTTTSDYFGLMAKLGYQNKNLFRGVELFDISLHGGYEFMHSAAKRNSFELGLTSSVSFPRFVAPFRLDRYNRTLVPRTRAELSYSIQRRPYYYRTIAAANWGYSWSNQGRSSFIFRPLDISVIKLRDRDEEFFNSIENAYLKRSYENKLVAGVSGSYIYNNKTSNTDLGTLALRVNFETSGNLIHGLKHVFSGRRMLSDSNTVFNIPYAQFFRVDANFSKRFILAPKSSLVYRLYVGWGYAYGNSRSVPFERMFYAGGPNSMRGWLPRTLGPGNGVTYDNSRFPQQVANFRLETNLELRFPLWDFINGATFVDVGNIWYMGQGGYNSAEKFKIDTFARQLGVNTGLGARLDFDFFVLRVDWGIRLHNPNEPVGNRWVKNFRFSNTAINFGVGYPF